MNPAKITLSQKEMDLVRNADWILTKNGILEKVKDLLAGLQEEQQAFMLRRNVPPELSGSSPKISRGENYGGLPYLILDYPRFFEQENILAVRTMFWWGNFFSITLHLSGPRKRKFEEKIIASYSFLIAQEYYLCIHEKEWEHHFAPDNYVSIATMSITEFENAIRESPFIKLANKLSLEAWEKSRGILLARFEEMMEMLMA